jgi:acyl-[acyl carrier protein]--UDP-N-acetylglucosamine O-acyltransferase
MSSLLFKPGVHSTAVVESGAKIGNNVSIGAYSFIGPLCHNQRQCKNCTECCDRR